MMQQSYSDSAASGLVSAASKAGVELGRLSAPQLGGSRRGVDLQRYQELQKFIALLQGLQVGAAWLWGMARGQGGRPLGVPQVLAGFCWARPEPVH